MMELKISKQPRMKNPSCAYCGRTFREKGLNLELVEGERSIHLPLCPSCFDLLPEFEATVDLEHGYMRLKR
ncbi:MAG: hypothetical protein NTY64_06520 [Deltaproteobacteria bacterium]|nr:hypothetical protein [Deltaproteobacteria bacterium]